MIARLMPGVRDEILSYMRAIEERTEIRTTTLLKIKDFTEFLRMASLQHTEQQQDGEVP